MMTFLFILIDTVRRQKKDCKYTKNVIFLNEFFTYIFLIRIVEFFLLFFGLKEKRPDHLQQKKHNSGATVRETKLRLEERSYG